MTTRIERRREEPRQDRPDAYVSQHQLDHYCLFRFHLNLTSSLSSHQKKLIPLHIPQFHLPPCCAILRHRRDPMPNAWNTAHHPFQAARFEDALGQAQVKRRLSRFPRPRNRIRRRPPPQRFLPKSQDHPETCRVVALSPWIDFASPCLLAKPMRDS